LHSGFAVGAGLACGYSVSRFTEDYGASTANSWFVVYD